MADALSAADGIESLVDLIEGESSARALVAWRRMQCRQRGGG